MANIQKRLIALDPVPTPVGRRRGVGRKPHPKACFERASLYQLEHPDVTLVHGVVTAGDIVLVFAHAWCELPEGVVFDGVDNAFYPTPAYREHLRVGREHRYTSKQAAERLLATGWYGGWDIDPITSDDWHGRD